MKRGLNDKLLFASTTRTPLRWWVNLDAQEGTRRITVKPHEHYFIWKSCWALVCVNKCKNTKNDVQNNWEARGTKHRSE
jgi:hypothetical protein